KARRRDVFCVRLVPYAQEKERQARAKEAAVRGLGSAWHAHRHSRKLSLAIRNRNQLPTAASGSHLHLYARSTFTLGVHGDRCAGAQFLGLDSRDSPGGRRRSIEDDPLGTLAIQTHARLDCTGRQYPTARRLRALRYFRPVTQSWNY